MLIGKKTILRPLEADDILHYYHWYNDQEFNYWLNAAWPINTMLNLAQLEDRFFSGSPDTTRYTILNEDEEPIGSIGFREVDHVARSAVLFIGIGEKDYWGKGYGTDALKVLIEYLLFQWNLNRLTIDTWTKNTRAIKTYEKLGFKIEGRLRQARFVQGTYYDAIIMGLLREEYIRQ